MFPDSRSNRQVWQGSLGAEVSTLITGEGMFVVITSTASSAASISEELEEVRNFTKIKPLMPVHSSR